MRKYKTRQYTISISFFLYTVESAYFEVTGIKKRASNYPKLELPEYIEKEIKKNVDDRSGMLYKCAGGWGWA